MNWRAFLAMLARDVRVARRNFMAILLQTFLQPLMFVFIFGRVMVRSGYMPEAYKSLLLPGIMAISMVFTLTPTSVTSAVKTGLPLKPDSLNPPSKVHRGLFSASRPR